MADPPPIPPGEKRMWELAASFPQQLRDGLKSVPRHDFPLRTGVPIVVAGMGGSGIAGELLSSLSARGGDSPIVPIRDFAFPAWVRPPVPSVFLSYSGETAEVVAAYEDARRRGLPRAVIASGGALLAKAKQDHVLTVQLPPGQPQRASLGYLLGGLVGLLREALPNVDRELPKVAESLQARTREFTEEGGLAYRLAEAWGGERDLWVYASESLLPVARRWKTQAEENAKCFGHYDAVPELLHNAIVAWDALPKERATSRFVALLQGRGDGEAISRRADYLRRALSERGTPVEVVLPESRGALGELLELVWLGDYVSLWSARRRGVDPLPVPGIERMKGAMASAVGGR